MKKSLRYITLFLVILIALIIMLRTSNIKFDSEKWKTWEETEATISLRWDMVNDLQDSYDLEGMSKKKIIDLLGTPENNTISIFRYYLGSSRQGINTGTLIIEFDSFENVESINVTDG